MPADLERGFPEIVLAGETQVYQSHLPAHRFGQQGPPFQSQGGQGPVYQAAADPSLPGRPAGEEVREGLGLRHGRIGEEPDAGSLNGAPDPDARDHGIAARFHRPGGHDGKPGIV